MPLQIRVPSSLTDAIRELRDDPLTWVQVMYPWGEGILADETGPDIWQADVLRGIGIHLAGGGIPNSSMGPINSSTSPPQNPPKSESYRLAVASGRGIGKTALLAWIIDWFCNTRPHCQVLVTSNTEVQLQTKTWRELAKWGKISRVKQVDGSGVFEWTATKYYMKQHPETWFAAAIPWNADRPEAFAGTHEKDVLIVFDEASGIPDVIWDTTQGVMTSSGSMWIVFGNPTKNSGRFFEVCFGKFRHRWETKSIDSRQSKRADKGEIENWIADYGEDSDYVRVMVRGVAPRSSWNQFISREDVGKCREYRAVVVEGMRVLIGVDVARFGDDQTVICIRQGRKVIGFERYRELDLMQSASRVAESIGKYGARLVLVDEGGVGGGVIDRLRQMGYGNVIGVQFGSSATDDRKWFNKRSEMWGLMREWLREGAEIPKDEDLMVDLCGPEYGFDKNQRIMLERKEDMKRRGLASPDLGDALALTFAQGRVVMPEMKRLSYRRELVA